MSLFGGWAEVDRWHRKLAARSSRLGTVHVSASTMARVLGAEPCTPKSRPAAEPKVRAPWPAWVVWKPNHIWAYDFTHFPRVKTAAVAILDVVSRKVADHAGLGRADQHPGCRSPSPTRCTARAWVSV